MTIAIPPPTWVRLSVPAAAVVMHVVVGVMLLLGLKIGGATNVAVMLQIVANPAWLGATLIAASIATSIAFSLKFSIWLRVLLILPQQFFLVATLIGVVLIVAFGVSPYGYVGPPPEAALSGQLPAVLLTVLHSIAVFHMVRS